MSEPKRIYGLIGYPVKHSLSPAMHNAAFKYLKERGEIDYDAEYKLFEVKPEELEGFLDNSIPVKDSCGNEIWLEDISGFNITIPHKIKAREILKNKFHPPLSEEILYYVRVSGAINTIDMTGKGYYNTDVIGFRRALKEDLKFDWKDKDVFLIGCGGAGRAIIAGLIWRATVKKIYIYDNNKESTESTRKHFEQFEATKNREYLIGEYKVLLKKLEFIAKGQIERIIKNCQLLVNASPIGMKEADGSMIDKKILHEKLYVYDLVYNRETQLIKDAKSLNLNARGGLSMLLYQGMSSFEIWTGKKAPQEVMWQALSSQISTK